MNQNQRPGTLSGKAIVVLSVWGLLAIAAQAYLILLLA